MARISLLDQDPERIQLLAELSYVATPREKIAEAMGVNKSTITEWRKDERVQKAITKLMRERAIRVRAQIDTRIEKILESNKELTPDQLIRIRAEFAGDLPDENTGDGAGVLTKLMQAAGRDPVLAKGLERAMADDRTA